MLHQVLPNGVEVVLKENHFAKMVAIQCWVGVGSIHERDDEAGMSHLIEHMLFKGTKKRAVGEISRTVEASGGDMNAYTTFDRTVFYLTLSSDHAKTGVDLLADAMLNSAFDAEELEREKLVILEEIKRGNDNPASKVGRKVFETIYRGTPAARPIIGYESQVAAYDRKKVLEFYRKWYQPKNFTVVAVGDFDSKEMFDWIASYFGEEGAPPQEKIALPPRQELKDILVHVIKGDYKQPRLELAYLAPPLEHADTPSLDLTAFALGAGDASRLNRRLRDKRGVVSSVGCSLYAAPFGGIFELSAFTTEPKFLEATEALAGELARIKYQDPVNETELQRARANLRADRVYQEESVVGQARALGFGLTTTHKTLYDDVYETLIDHTTVSHVQNAMQRWIDDRGVVIVALLPESSELSEKDLRAAYEKGFRQGREHKVPRAELAVKSKAEEGTKPQVVDLKPGIKLVYRQNLNSQLFNLIAASEGGLRAETESEAGLFYYISELLGTATTTRDYENLLHLVEGTGAVIQGFSGKDSFGFKLQCLSNQIDSMIHTWADCLLNPIFPEEQWERIKREVREAIEAEGDSPFKIAARLFQEKLFENHPYRWPAYGRESSLQGFDTGSLLQRYLKERDAGPWVLSCVTALPLDEVKDLLSQVLETWNPTAERRSFSQVAAKMRPLNAENLKVEKKREQTHIMLGTRGINWADPDRPALDVLGTILGGSGGRLFLRLRDEESLAYTVSPMITYGCHPGVIGAYIACAPEKKDHAMAALERELRLIATEKVSKDELSRAINYLVGGHEADLQRGDSQAMTMALMEAYGIGYDDFLSYPVKIKAVTADDVLEVGRRLLEAQPRLSVTVGL